jgi:hypothetical protein
MLLSLESKFNVEALIFDILRAISNQRYRRAGEIRPGSKNISEADRGSTGTQESLTPPRRNSVYQGLTETEQSGHAG